MGHASQSRTWENELSLKSRLRSMEHEKEPHHAEATKCINERLEHHYRRDQTPQDIEEGEDEIPHQKSRHQNCADQCQQRSVFECHGRSMDVGGVQPQPELLSAGTKAAWAASQHSKIVLLRFAYPEYPRLMFSYLRSAVVAALLLISLQLIEFGDDTQAPAINPESAAADQLYRAAKFAEAEASYQALLKTDSKLVTAQVGLVRAMLRQQKIDEALDAVNTALGGEPNSAALLAAKGDVQFRLAQMPDTR